jgi:opacity protein-like surface antigen
MKKLLLVALLLTSAAPAVAQDDVRGIGVKGGWLWPGGQEFEESFGGTWVVGADLAARGRLLGLGIDAKFSRKQAELEAAGVIADATWTSIPVSGNLYLNLFVDQGSTLYVGAGPTYAYTKVDSVALSSPLVSRFSEAQWNWGWNAVAGAGAGQIYVEAQLVRVSQDVASDQLQLGGFNLTIGFRF